MTRYDKNSNGYIDKEEMAGNLAGTFETWDTNGDDKVYAEEIKDAYDRQLAPQMSQVRATVTAQGNALYSTLDANGDGRIGLREMRTAPQRILSLDKNGDGRLSQDEVPPQMAGRFASGDKNADGFLDADEISSLPRGTRRGGVGGPASQAGALGGGAGQ